MTQGNMASFLTRPLEDIHLAAINALCFKWTWSDKVDKDLTQEREFHSQSGVKYRPLLWSQSKR
ncbi:MAG: hypothetical protein HDR88_18780 [Bacteroides sp.]|nr:hypothetical protein [Bacteroides sp.]